MTAVERAPSPLGSARCPSQPTDLRRPPSPSPPEVGAPPLELVFDASASADPDGAITRYAWEFGDGQLGSVATATHAYPAPGTELGEMGYELDRNDPGPGAVVGFDSRSKGQVLTTDAHSPTDYIGVIQGWLRSTSSGSPA